MINRNIAFGAVLAGKARRRARAHELATAPSEQEIAAGLERAGRTGAELGRRLGRTYLRLKARFHW